MRSPLPPCKDCDERTPGCHSRCPGYRSYKEEVSEYKDSIRRAKSKEDHYVSARKRSKNIKKKTY